MPPQKRNKAIAAPMLAPILEERETRDRLRSQVRPSIEEVNRMIARGWRITRVDETIWGEDFGFHIMFTMEHDDAGDDEFRDDYRPNGD